jgi:hypothetical protein
VRRLVALSVVVAVAGMLASCGGVDPPGVGRRHRGSVLTGSALVAGDSVVAVAARAGVPEPGIGLYGYAGEEPHQYGVGTPGRMSVDWDRAGRPKTVVLNWNGNNPRHLSGTALVASYQHDLKEDIEWYLSHGVERVILAAAVPSAFNDASREVPWKDPASAEPGRMLGNSHLNAMYRHLAGEFFGKVFYSKAAADAIHPGMIFNQTLNGHPCISDYIHEAPYCAKIYEKALEYLAGGSM